MKKMHRSFFVEIMFPKDFKLIWPYFKGQHAKILAAVLAMLLSLPAAGGMSYLLKEFLDGKSTVGIWPLLVAAAILYALQIGAAQFGRFAIINALMKLRIDLDVRKAHAKEYGLLPANSFEAVPTDLEGLEEALRSTLEMLQGIFGVIGYLLAMYLIGSYTGLAASAVPLIFSIPILLLYHALLNNGTAHRALSSKGNRAHRLASVHAGIRDFMINNERRSDGRMSRFAHVYGILDQDNKVQKAISFQEGTIEWIARWGGIVSIVAAFAIAGAVPGAAGIAIVILLERYGDSLVDVFKGGSGVQRGHVAMERSIYKLLTLPQAEIPTTTKPFSRHTEVVVKNLSLKNVFKGISFKASRSHPTIIEGSRGSGKTPLLEILCGLRPPSSGYIAIGSEVWSAGELRKVVYPVFGSPFVSWELDTIATLFRSVREKVNDAEIWDSLHKIGGKKLLDAVQHLPHGLDTPVVDPRSGRKGLSESEMYLMGLAVASIVSHPILCIDMPDRYQGFIPALKKLAKDKIVIVTAEDAQCVNGISDQMEVVPLQKKPAKKSQGASTTQTTLNAIAKPASESKKNAKKASTALVTPVDATVEPASGSKKNAKKASTTRAISKAMKQKTSRSKKATK